MNKLKFNLVSMAVASSLSLTAIAAELEIEKSETEETIEEITVIGKSVSYANNVTKEEMFKQQSNLTSALAVIDNLPGVLINEGDTFGSDDWSTTVSIRGFQLSLDQQQIGITIDGIANGNSNYGGGAKANRYIDTENLKTVEVSQGTADIASRSNEALGGSLNFTTIDPEMEESSTFSYSQGSFNAQKYFVRYQTGEIAPNTYAWASFSSSSNSDWVEQSAENVRDHFALKFVSEIKDISLTGYYSWDDTHEDNYQRVSMGQFEQNPEWDRLTGEWTGVPYVDQLYRKGWSTLRENVFAYLKADFTIGKVDFSTNVYVHNNEGRGDWVPPYLVDVNDDGSGNPHSELNHNTTNSGGDFLGRIFFVDANGNSLAPLANCNSSIIFPYGGSSSEFDPSCYQAGAIPVGSFRNTHYQKERTGFNLDFEWKDSFAGLENTLRGGLWLENYNREESRDWHKIIDSRVGYEFDYIPYWIQYDREYPVDTTMLYLENTIKNDFISARVGIKQFLVDLERQDKFSNTSMSISSDSDVLLSAGLVAQLPIEGLEVFAGYAENFASVKDEVLERDASTLTTIEPETAENIDLGLRYFSQILDASINYYQIDFDNRLTFIAPDSPDGIDFLIGTNGSYVNTGGIESSGIEASINYYPTNEFSLYLAYTANDSQYVDGSVGFPSGNTVFGSVEDMLVLSADWKKDQHFAGISTKWVGERWLNSNNTQRLDDYNVADFYIGTQLDNIANIKNLEFRLTVNNLFDEDYLGGVAGQSAWIGAPRTTTLNFTATF